MGGVERNLTAPGELELCITLSYVWVPVPGTQSFHIWWSNRAGQRYTRAVIYVTRKFYHNFQTSVTRYIYRAITIRKTGLISDPHCDPAWAGLHTKLYWRSIEYIRYDRIVYHQCKFSNLVLWASFLYGSIDHHCFCL